MAVQTRTRPPASDSAVASRVRSIAEKLSLSQGEIGQMLQSSQRTVNRWATGESTPHAVAKQRLLELGYISDELLKLMKRPDANLWLFSPNKRLKGESPSELIRRGESKKVRGLIEALAEGIVV